MAPAPQIRIGGPLALLDYPPLRASGPFALEGGPGLRPIAEFHRMERSRCVATVSSPSVEIQPRYMPNVLNGVTGLPVAPKATRPAPMPIACQRVEDQRVRGFLERLPAVG